MQIIPVSTARLAHDFIHLPHRFYKDDPNWISPLDDDIRAVFDPELNSFFKHGVCTRWLLRRDGATIGRIAAFINFEKAQTTKTGGIGFFECIDDQAAANLLFDTAATWLRAQGMEAMDGPINFGENEKYWGLLVEGFKPPSLGMNYNPPYYAQLFETYGFRKQYDQLTNFLDATIPLPERFTKISGWVMAKPGYSFRHFSYADREKFFKDFQDIYDDAWSNFDNFTPLSPDVIRESFRQMKAIMDEKIIWFAYYKDEPIAFVLCLPDANQILRHLHGKMNLWAKLKFLYYRKTTTIDRLRIIVMGCKKKYQNHGIESALVRCLQEEVLPRHTIKGVELAWVGDFNQKMLAIHEATGATTDKVHRTYRYIFSQQ
ncbi:GNAT family N-acetyltransferase [Dinghuibacter silviterrae]|uniref:Acetyltransferase (GNAT) family protein n=1 Tax=Dinghuibacter silviterrae TaxID=1539049 RepID=A0A4R8DTR0_9BACT|nr:GNAT family N-acetyltransferase [Dinghuibacter silviterrae]TDX01700.1 acetyltransferase (GNAT) family protein [Dinghuibacter silviterrae]